MKLNKKNIRLAKFIANSGFCSRRKAEELILAKSVKVNGKTVDQVVTFVNDQDQVMIDQQVLASPKEIKLYIYYKPKGCICAKSDPEGRSLIYDNLPKNLQQLLYIGRLDYQTEGLLLLTNNGDLANYLAHPKSKLKKVYLARVYGKVTQHQLDELAYGITLDNIYYKPMVANIVKNSKGKNLWIEFILEEGKNKQIRKICDALNLQVNRLIRIAYGSYKLLDMKANDLREIDVATER